MKKVIIFCDGACSGNGKEENVGGWGAVLKYKENEKRIFGGAPKTTNNIMELTAAIEALKLLQSKQIDVNIYSDSAYVVNCFNNGWYHKWRINGWLTSKKEPVENQTLWMTLIDLVESFENVRFYKIKGHLNPANKKEIEKWHQKFNQEHATRLSESEFLELVKLNHIADALANEGMAPFKQKTD